MLSQKPLIAASMLAADFAALGEEATRAGDAGADWLHLDIMDNHYVPNLTFGAAVTAALSRGCALPLDAHLMTERVETLIEPFAAAGAARLTFHPDATPHAHRVATAIRAANMRVGIAINPAKPLDLARHLLDEIDLALVMTVNPGFGGQRFIEAMLPKISALRRMIDDSGRDIYLQVDGGINADTARRCRDAGADVLVAGSFIFNSASYADAVRQLRG